MTRDWNTLSDDEFRAEAARFVDIRCPAAIRHQPHRPRWAQSREWYLTMSREGWLAPGWPREFGGMGLEPSKQLIYLEEWERHGAPMAAPQGVMNVGPALILFGTDAQRAKYLPKILSGEHRWCQGFSEPNSGSDLASVRTEARLEGDHWIINGHKIWTSGALDANQMYALVRTDKSAKKQAGLTFLLYSMDQPGITVRPIRTIAGGEEFCEVFLDNVRAHVDDVVGGVNNGWKVANGLLGFERLWSGSSHQCQLALDRLLAVARALGRERDPLFLDRYTRLELDVLDLASTYTRSTQKLRETRRVGFEASLLKVWATETCQRINDAILELAGSQAALAEAFDEAGVQLDLTGPYLESRSITIYGGSAQIHRNILAKNVLKLPS